MNKIMMAAVCALLPGCASLKYPNWESVNIVNSVENKPCAITGKKEQCSDSRDDCEEWFKKRATLVQSNTVVMRGFSEAEFIGRYFQCKAGIPIYKSATFNKQEYGQNANIVTGQAFLTQKGGGVVTCAGNTVEMYPDTGYFTEKIEDMGHGNPSEYNFNSEDKAFYKTSQCDAQGNFEFHKIPSGKWIITVDVSWNVGFVRNNGFFYYTDNRMQGGYLKKAVTVQDGEINKFIISQ